MRVFTVIATREGRLRFRFLKMEHGLLHDHQEKKTYAVVSDAYPTNRQGRWSRAYLVHETSGQTIRLATGEEREVHGGTVSVADPLNMVAKIRMPGPRGADGELRDVHLTAEAIYDRTMSVQVRRLGNRRIQWFHALLFVSLGVAICLALVAAIMMFNGAGSPDAAPPPDIQLNGNAPVQPPPAQSAPTQEPGVVVRPASQSGESTGG